VPPQPPKADCGSLRLRRQRLSVPAVGTTEKLPRINIAGQPARRNTSQVVAPSGIWTAEHSRSVGVTRKRPTSRWHRPVSAGPIFLNRVTDQCASGRSGRRPDGSRAHVSGGRSADDRPGCRTVARPSASWTVARAENKGTQGDARKNGEKSSFHK